MTDLDFYADLMKTGTVLGADHTSTVAEVKDALGPELDVALAGLIHDFDLVEFGWHRARRQDPWTVTYYGAQTHRLPWLARDGEIGAALTGRYGSFRRELHLDDLRAITACGGDRRTRRGPCCAR